ncbi:carbohydrate esterase family 9 protein [Favolaschia claudopus]|uniref:Carbohydrate esterase family 9 protein n=1 Tax=Favolaschia claudopus TaxID=2862362 RepID=A0AAW0A481_9AGAR
MLQCLIPMDLLPSTRSRQLILLVSFFALVFNLSDHFPRRHVFRTPGPSIRAEDIRLKCQNIQSSPGPSPFFLKREVSDRFEIGTNSTLITNATILVGKGNETSIRHGDLYLDKGIVKAIGSLSYLKQANVLNLTVINANEAWVTPGLVDLDTHLGLMSAPFMSGALDASSTKGPTLPWLRNIDGLNPHDEGMQLAIAGGVTSAQILARNSNNIAGQTVIVKLRQTSEGSPLSMVVEPPHSLNKSADSTRWRHLQQACGEVPSEYGNRPDAIWALRAAYARAQNIKAAQDAYCQQAEANAWDDVDAFPENLQYESLVDVLRGKVKVTTQCQGAVDIDALVRLTNEFEFSIASIQHASEAWLVPGLVNRTWGGPPTIALFATNYRYDSSSYRGSEFAPRVLTDAGITVAMKSAHPVVNSRYLLQEAQRANYYGLDSFLALASVTSIPAAAIGLDHRIGSLHEGADADVVMWDSNPLQLGATPVRVWIDGILQIPLPPRIDRDNAINEGIGKEGEEWRRFPSVPKWENERKKAIQWEGLPPLMPRKQGGNIVFLNVKNVWTREGAMRPGSRSHSNLVHITVKGGRIVCFGDDAACPLESVEEYLDLDGGHIAPGMMTFGSSLGLEEISSEPSTGDGSPYNPFIEPVPPILNDPAALASAAEALMFGTRSALTAYRFGVTSATVRETSSGDARNIISGLSTTISTGASHAMERGAIIQKYTALHVAIQRPDPISKTRQVSVSNQIAGLRRLLLGWETQETDTKRWSKKAAEGVIPLVIDVGSADIMATLLILKTEVENQLGTRMRMVFSGAAEAHIIAPEIRNSNVGVILDAKPGVGVWDDRRALPGLPLTNDTTLAVLFKEGVKLGLRCQEAQDARNMLFDLTWAMLASNGVIKKKEAYALVSSNLQDLLGVVTEDVGDLVAYAGGGPFDMSSKTAAVISASRGVVDVF